MKRATAFGQAKSWKKTRTAKVRKSIRKCIGYLDELTEKSEVLMDASVCLPTAYFVGRTWCRESWPRHRQTPHIQAPPLRPRKSTASSADSHVVACCWQCPASCSVPIHAWFPTFYFGRYWRRLILLIVIILFFFYWHMESKSPCIKYFYDIY